MAPVEFYDSNPGPFDTNPGHYPPGAQYAMLYADTSLEPGYRPQPERGVPHVRYITRRGGADAARYAGAADYEPGNVVFEGDNLGAWAGGRNGSGLKARIYVDRSNVALAFDQVQHLSNIWWWIPTLDNNPHWTPATIVASVRASSGITLPEDRIWGIQWGKAELVLWDTSYLFGQW